LPPRSTTLRKRSGGLGAVAGAILEPGDEVLILAPFWPLIDGIVRSFHGAPVHVPVLAGEVDSAAAAVAAAEARRSARTVALYLSTPNNPSGRLLPRAWIEALVAWAARHDLWMISDEAYEALRLSRRARADLPLAPERTFLAQTFSKCYGVAGNRCGYVVGPREVMSRAPQGLDAHVLRDSDRGAALGGRARSPVPGEAWAARRAPSTRKPAAAPPSGSACRCPRARPFSSSTSPPRLDERGLEGLLSRLRRPRLLVAPGPSFGPYPTHVRLCYTAVEPERALRGVECWRSCSGDRRGHPALPNRSSVAFGQGDEDRQVETVGVVDRQLARGPGARLGLRGE
jgi:aspartate/methionine/tyrosine aminotransferase